MTPTPEKLPETIEERIERFRVRMLRFHNYSWRAHRIYYWCNLLVVAAGLAVAPSITIVALKDNTFAAAVLGAIMTFLLGVQSAFKLAEHARHWEVMHNRAKNLRTILEACGNRDEAFLTSLTDSWLTLRMDLMDGLPGPPKLDEPGK